MEQVDQFDRVGAVLKQHFLLDPDVVYLNHGAYGATPKPVFDSYQRWQRIFENEPVDFLTRNGPQRLAASRQALADYLATARDNLVYVSNGTTAINMVARSMALTSGDELLTTNHEHGGVERMWQYFSQKHGFVIKKFNFPVPVESHEAFIEGFWSCVGNRTKVIFLSHISSPTALLFPVAEICRRAREAGILTIIDGSHAPGQIPLDIEQVGADFYIGITHKWLCAPKGSAFLYARPEKQSLLDPLIISWGWKPIRPGPSKFVEYHEWQGSRDISAFLAVADAIAFHAQHDWPLVSAECKKLANFAQQAISEVTGFVPYSGGCENWYAQIVCIPLPHHIEPLGFREMLRNQYNIDVSTDIFQDQPRIRVSVQGYNSQADIDYLVETLAATL